MTVPPGKQCTLGSCEEPALNPEEPGALCRFHHPDHDTPEPVTESETSRSEIHSQESDTGSFRDVDFTNPSPGVWPDELLDRRQWMGHVEKKPFAPWGDRDAPAPCNEDGHTTADECDCDARWKWGYTEQYVDGETVAMAVVDDRLDGRAFLQQPDDPFVYVDGDDVRCPETGETHPAFAAILEHLGLTYADISQSGTGVHAIYRGELPDGVKQASWQLDTEPWGANDDTPSIEIYPGKRVCVMTGDHVPGTPTSVQEWNADVLEPLLEANDEVATSQRDARPSTTRGDYDFTDYTPSATSSEETTDDIRDVFAALDRLDAQRVASRTIVHAWNDDASTSTGYRAFHPTWGKHSNGTANIVNDQIWQDTGDQGGYGGPVVMALIHAGELQPEHASPRAATGHQWFQGIEVLRDLGFSIPRLETPDTTAADHVAILPQTRRLENTVQGWDWEHAATQQNDDGLSIEAARERTTQAIADAYQNRGARVLIEALPTMGKSYGAIKAAHQTGAPITLLTGRGRKEQYEQFRGWASDHDLSVYTLPAFTRDCTTAAGEHGEDWQERVRDWYQRGATPKQIHAQAEYVTGHPLPCQTHEGQRCPYASKWDFDPNDYDVLLGHYSHAHKQKVTGGRTIVFDEFPDNSYETTLEGQLPSAISTWLQATPEVPYADYTDLIEHRSDQTRRAQALTYLLNGNLEPAEDHVMDTTQGHAAAPIAAFTILTGEDLGNGFEHTRIEDHGTGVRNRETGAIHLLQPPCLDYTNGVVALDGTPTMEMWRKVLATHLTHDPVLTPTERRNYIQDALGLHLVPTTDAIKPYNSPGHVNVAQDAALIETIHDHHDQRPAVITTSTAEHEYETSDIDLPIAASKHYGNVLGSNEYSTHRLGAVIGSNHYGDDYLKKWGAYHGHSVERNQEKGQGLSYGDFGDQVLTHMREHDTLQAAMRFGRDGEGAVVYIHTNTLPQWVPTSGEGRVLKTWSHGMKEVLEAARDLTEWITREIADAVSIGERQVRAHLTTLATEYDVLTRHTESCGYVWEDDGLHKIGEHGDVDLTPIDPTTLSEEESAELARTTYYTWEFRTSRPASRQPRPEPGEVATDGGRMDGDGGDRPPDDRE